MKTEFVRYLERLSELYPTIDKASTEIINLQSILNLPKGTEHFLSDIHGEYESFSHVLRNGSGAVRKKIDDVFGHTLGTNDKSELASLIYYPKEKIDYIKSLDKDTENWYKITLYRLIEICKVVSSKYTRSKVRKALPPAYAYVIEELITEKPEVLNRGAYYDGIVNTILEIGAAEKFIIAIAELIQRLVVDHLHIIGDIYDRGSENVYKMKDVNFPTIDKENPYKLTEREEDMMNKLYSAFVKCEKLQKHMQLMLKKGGMYKVYNGNLLFHGCVPMNSDGSFKAVNVNGKEYSGKDLYDAYEACVRKVLVSNNKKEKSIGGDILWYLWSGSGSPLFGRDRMTTFERYFIEDKTSHHEEKNAYYDLIETEDATNRIFEEFGLDGTGHIINGHVPVHQSEGENPLKCDGKVIMIDGGFSKPYHKVTGIAGYTLTYNSYGLTLTAHEPFESAEQVIQNGKDIVSNQVAVQHAFNRILVGDTDNGKKLKENIADLKELIEAYRQGIISEREK